MFVKWHESSPINLQVCDELCCIDAYRAYMNLLASMVNVGHDKAQTIHGEGLLAPFLCPWEGPGLH